MLMCWLASEAFKSWSLTPTSVTPPCNKDKERTWLGQKLFKIFWSSKFSKRFSKISNSTPRCFYVYVCWMHEFIGTLISLLSWKLTILVSMFAFKCFQLKPAHFSKIEYDGRIRFHQKLWRSEKPPPVSCKPLHHVLCVCTFREISRLENEEHSSEDRMILSIPREGKPAAMRNNFLDDFPNFSRNKWVTETTYITHYFSSFDQRKVD